MREGKTDPPIYARQRRRRISNRVSLAGIPALHSRVGPLIAFHVLPNVLSPLLVLATLWIPGAILTEASLSFLGLGVMPPTPTWGNMLNEARGAPLEYLFTQTLSPGFCIFVTVLAINLVGDGLRDALDPKLKNPD